MVNSAVIEGSTYSDSNFTFYSFVPVEGFWPVPFVPPYDSNNELAINETKYQYNICGVPGV